MGIPGQTGEKGSLIMSKKFLRAVLVSVVFGMSMLYLNSAKAGSIDWSIHFDLLVPPPYYGHGHGNGHGHNNGWTNDYVNCASYYMSHGCNQYGYNCIQMPHSECRGGQFVGPYRPPYQDYRGTMHQHSWRCNQRHWHGNHFSHQHHADGHHTHDPHMMQR